MKSTSGKLLTAVVHRLGDRLAEAEGDRVAALLDLVSRRLERGKLAAAVAVGWEAVDACGADPARRCDALCAIAQAMLAAEAYDLAGELAVRAVNDAVAAAQPDREARARELHGQLLLRRGLHAAARKEYRIAGVRHRLARDMLAMKRTAKELGHSYRLQAMAAAATGRHDHAQVNLRQALRAYRIALATGECANDDAAIAAAAAECESRRGNYGLARIQVARALALAPLVDDPEVRAQIHLAECRLLRCTGDLRAAEWSGERACVAARALRDDTLANALQALADVHDAQGRFERATDVENQSRELLIERHRALALLRSELKMLWRREAGAPAAVAAGTAC